MIPTFDTSLLQAIKSQLTAPKRITLISHIAPDGDAVGSTLALRLLLEKLGHMTEVVYPTFFPESYNILQSSDRVHIAKNDENAVREAIASAEVIFCLDFNEPKRVEFISDALLESKAYKILIDHHLFPADFVDVTLSYPALSSTCLLLYHFIHAMGWQHLLDRDIAEAIYWGMMTDTGNFSYNSEDPSIYTTLSHLLELGIRKDMLTAEVQRGFTVDKLRLNAHAIINNLRVFPEYKSAIITLTNREKAQFNYRVGDTEGLVNVPLEAKEIVFSIFIYEVNKQVKVSLRSKGDFPCNEFAKRFFNGGGHKNASGAELYTSLYEAYNLVLAALKVMHP